MRALLAPPLAAALLAVAGCGIQHQGPDPSAQRLAALTSRGVQVDYTPLASPREALAKGDLVIHGTVTDVIDGPSVKYPNPLYTQRDAGGYVTYVLTVDEVLAGDPTKLRNRRVYATVEKSPSTRTDDLAAANSEPSVVAVLDDISDWKPTPDATVTRPAATPADAPLFFAYTDGLWLQDAGAPEMTGVQADPSELPAAWNHPKTVADVTAALRAAKG